MSTRTLMGVSCRREQGIENLEVVVRELEEYKKIMAENDVTLLYFRHNSCVLNLNSSNMWLMYERQAFLTKVRTLKEIIRVSKPVGDQVMGSSDLLTCQRYGS